MNPRKIITSIAVLFIIAGTLYLKGSKDPEAEASPEALKFAPESPALLDLYAPG